MSHNKEKYRSVLVVFCLVAHFKGEPWKWQTFLFSSPIFLMTTQEQIRREWKGWYWGFKICRVFITIIQDFCECFISSFVISSLLCHKTKVSTVLCKRCERWKETWKSLAKVPPNGVLLLLFSRTNSESQSGKVIHKKSVGKAGNSKNSNFPLSPLIFYVLLSRFDFQSSSVKIMITEPH